ncbi:glycosyltransferase family 4 protein [Patescibacteria group bacterium]|nr:glycosyltransferase family 4 protein [Patescibacteria group bacterium]
MKILVHQPRLSYFIGGGETVPLQQAEILSQLGHKVEILTSKPPKYSEIYEEFKIKNPQVLLHELELKDSQRDIYKEIPGKDWSRWDREAIYFGQTANDFYSLANDYDLVVTHLLSDSLFVPLKYNNVLHLHGVPSKWRSFDEIFLSRPNHFVSVSEYVTKGWRTLYPLLRERSIDTCYNGINSNKYLNQNKTRDIDLLYVGRLIQIKGIFDIIKALGVLKQGGLKINKLVVVGAGPELERMKSESQREGVDNLIEFDSNIPTKKLIDYYNRSKIFLCPSYDKEGVLTTMLEAASCGCAIITADCCGMVEFARSDVNSKVVIPQNPQSLADSINLILTDDNLRKKLVTKAANDIKESWDTEQTVNRLIKVYEKYVK